MAKKKRHIASFEQVSDINDGINDDINDDVNVNISKNNNETRNDNDSVNVNVNIHDELDEVLEATKPKEKTHILKGIYFEVEVARAIDRVARKQGKGAKSQIVNAAVKKVFKEKGWL